MFVHVYQLSARMCNWYDNSVTAPCTIYPVTEHFGEAECYQSWVSVVMYTTQLQSHIMGAVFGNTHVTA